MGKEGLRDLGFIIPKDGKVMAQQAIMLNKVEEELPSASEITKADNIELQEITENAARSTEGLITQLDDHPLGDSFEHPLHKLLGLDKELRIQRLGSSVGRALTCESRGSRFDSRLCQLSI